MIAIASSRSGPVAEQLVADRLSAAVTALRACGLTEEASTLGQYPSRVEHCRDVVRRRLQVEHAPEAARKLSAARDAVAALWGVL